jgi:hypothetical protein
VKIYRNIIPSIRKRLILQIYNRNNNGSDDNNDDDDSDDDADDDNDSDGDDDDDMMMMIVTCLVNEPDNIVFPNCTLSMLI